MKRWLNSLSVLMAFSGSGALANDAAQMPTPQWQQAEAAAALLARTPEKFQFANMRDISIGLDAGAEGGAYLVRERNKISARVMAADLQPGHAYTFWWIFFNRPGLCASTPCADTDLMASRGGIHFGAGAIAGANGVANVSFSTQPFGPPTGAVFNPNLPRPGLMFDNGFNAEVHLVLVDHGIPSRADFNSADPDAPGTWAWELTHALPPGPSWVRAVVFPRL